MYRGTLTQSADPETKKDVAIKTIKSMCVFPEWHWETPRALHFIVTFYNIFTIEYLFLGCSLSKLKLTRLSLGTNLPHAVQ